MAIVIAKTRRDQLEAGELWVLDCDRPQFTARIHRLQLNHGHSVLVAARATTNGHAHGALYMNVRTVLNTMCAGPQASTLLLFHPGAPSCLESVGGSQYHCFGIQCVGELLHSHAFTEACSQFRLEQVVLSPRFSASLLNGMRSWSQSERTVLV